MSAFPLIACENRHDADYTYITEIDFIDYQQFRLLLRQLYV